jgi:hypothetical protein
MMSGKILLKFSYIKIWDIQIRLFDDLQFKNEIQFHLADYFL